jgi:phage gpG-like protein
MINWTIDDSEVFEQFNNMDEVGYNVDYNSIGSLLVDSVHQNFDEEGRPDAWQPRQDDNPWPILRRTGNLYNSITYQTHTDGVDVYSTTDYADYHDSGTSRLPARPFLIIQPEDADEIENLIWEHLWDE